LVSHVSPKALIVKSPGFAPEKRHCHETGRAPAGSYVCRDLRPCRRSHRHGGGWQTGSEARLREGAGNVDRDLRCLPHLRRLTILQGQHADYLIKQLAEFKSGKRDNPVMKGFAATLSDADARNVAAFYESKQAKPGFAKNKELVALGEKIYRGGIADRSIPACAACHSPNGAGIPSQYPRLSGQHADYTEAQLIAFRSGARKNSSQMSDVATKLNDREIKAVSDYIAGLR
jgi:cytochrome c553